MLGLTEAMLKFLDRLCGPKRSQLRYWRSLGQRLCELAQHSDAAEDFKCWRVERSKDDINDEDSDEESHDQSQERVSRAPWCFPRFSRRLPSPVRKHLYARLVEQKRQPGYPCERMGEKDAERWIVDYYFDGDKTEPQKIFRHIYDIAWQCMLTRSIDFLSGEGGPRKQGRNWIANLQCHAALGREFYQLALETHYDQSQPTFHYLLIVMHQLERLFEDEDKQRQAKLNPALRSKLQEWLGCEQNQKSHKQSWLNDRIKELDELFDNKFPPNSMHEEGKREEFEKEAPDIAEQHTALTWRDFYGWFRHHGLEFYSNREVDPDPCSQRYEERLRTLDKLLRRKLDQLIEILRKQCGLNPGDPVYPLFGYLESTRLAERGGTDGRMQRLIEALRSGEDCHVPDYYLIGRIATAGSYPAQDEKPDQEKKQGEEDPDRLTYWLLRFKGRGYRWDGERTVCRPPQDPRESGQHGKRYYQEVLGRYDVVAWIKTRPMCRCTLPEFHPDEPEWELEEFPSFFVRREQAVPVRLDPTRPFPKDEKEDNEKEKKRLPVLAILSVTLTQRYACVDALYRLLRAWDKYAKGGKYASGNGYEKLQIEQVIPWLDADKDRLFLTDGWGDLLFMLSGEPSEERLQKVFAIQGTFFEDFMVDRTELMLAVDCIPVAAASSRFQLSVQLRLMEDRTLEYGNSVFREQVKRNIEGSWFWRDFKQHITLSRTPGRTDYTMTFPDLDNLKAERLFELFKGTQINTIQTTIGRKIKWLA